MKLAYSNWHKELVHDDGIRAELNVITNGQLEFDSTPFVKLYRPNENRDNRAGSGFGENRFKRSNNNNSTGSFQRNPRDSNAGGRDGSIGGTSRDRDSRNAGNGINRDNRNTPNNGSANGRDNRNNNKFGGNKKRF